MSARRAKIVCTIGPACDSEQGLEDLINAGMDVARLNFSHGTHEDHKIRYERIRRAAEKCRKPVAILQDLCGPKIRLGQITGEKRPIEAGTNVYLTEDRPPECDEHLPVQYEGLVEDVQPGDSILIDDGRVNLTVSKIEGDRVLATVKQGGQIRNRVGVHLPSRRMRVSALTEKDKADLVFGLSLGVDYVALSFVRHAEDTRLVREICEAWGRPTPVISKIETPDAVDNIVAIVEASDGVMVARGDLGVEFPPERVPVIQKEIIMRARENNCPVIVATEMLHSMVTSSRPTRAEASDVAHAVYDGTDCVMLSGETATGAHPSLACRMMARIVSEAERSTFYDPQQKEACAATTVVESVARNAASMAEELDARLIVAFTEGGDTARLVSKARPPAPIVAFSPNERTRRALALLWGVIPSKIEGTNNIDVLVERASGILLARGLASPGDRTVVVFGAPLGVRGSTNTIRVRVVG